MKKDTIVVSQEEKEKIEAWKSKLMPPTEEHSLEDVLDLILYKLHLLDKKMERIDYQMKNHWASSKK